MELGRFNAESSPPPPEGDGGQESSKKKKKHRGGKTPDVRYDAGLPKEHEAEKPKRPAPDKFAPLLERITSDLKPDEEKSDKAEKQRENRAEKDEKRNEKKELDDAALEQLTPEERRQAAEIYLDEREQHIATEREEAEPESTEATIAEAVDAFLAKTREKLAANETDVDEAATESLAETSQEYAPEADQVAEDVAGAYADTVTERLPAAEQPVAEPSMAETSPGADESDVAHTLSYEDMPPHMGRERLSESRPGEEAVAAPYELSDSDVEEHDEPPVPPAAYAYNFQPPQPQVTYNRPAMAVPVVTAEAARTAEEVAVPVGTALVVGFAAYLLGKRRGRIRTEQRLMPVQKKFEREVRAIHGTLAAKEMELRQLVRAQADLRRATERMTQEVAAAAGVAAAARMPERVVVPQAERPEMRAVPSAGQQGVERQPLKPELAMNDPVPAVRTPEQLAAQLIADAPERVPMLRNEMSLEAAPSSPLVTPVANRYERPRSNVYDTPEISPLPERTPLKQEVPVASMTREEVAKAADEIIVGAATVRQVFETNLISERGMRRVVAEAKRGGDIRRVLAEEMMIKETGYERDPRLRDQPVRHAQDATSAQPAMSQGALPTTIQSTEENVLPAPSSAPQLVSSRRQTRSRVAPVTQSALIAANIIALIILGILLLILFVIHL